MKVTIKLFASFRTGRFKQEQKNYPEGTTCAEVVVDIGVPKEEIGIILVNGRHAALESGLNDRDCLSLFPLLGGG